MAIKIENVPVQALLAYQQIIEVASREMHDFFGKVVKDQKEGLVSTSYKDQLEKKLAVKIQANNVISHNIEKEVFRRVANAFGRGATTSKIQSSLYHDYNLEVESFEKIKKGRKVEADKIQKKHAPVKKLSTSVSSEKTVKK
jgi:hypothetical protein